MTPTAIQLLAALGSGVSLPSIGGGGSSSGLTASGATFDELLKRAEAGEASGVAKPVGVDPASGVSLSSAELDAVSKAADRAEAQGVDRAVVLVGGQAVVLDVESRMVVGRVNTGADDALLGVEAVFSAAVDEAEELAASPAPKPDAGGAADGGEAAAVVNPRLPAAVSGRDPLGRVENPAVRALAG